MQKFIIILKELVRIKKESDSVKIKFLAEYLIKRLIKLNKFK